MDKPTKPTDLIPRSFGGVKNNFSQSLQSSGYEDGVPAIYGGDNLNYQLDATGKELDYCEKICDFINNIPIGKTITVDGNNKLIYEENKTVRHVGEIVISTIPLTDAGLHLLDGALIQGSGSYSAFVTYIAGLVTDYPNLFVTEAQWQTAVTTYSVCGKFVYDSVNNTVRLPKITGFIEGTTDLTALSDLVEAGLPNITGTSSVGFDLTQGDAVSGAFYKQTVPGKVAPDNSGTFLAYRTLLNASRSSSIYGNSSTVQPQAIKVLYYIVIATSTKTDIEVDIDEIATDLNGKADTDLSNITTTGKKTACGWLTPDYANGITVAASSSSEQSYTAPSIGWFNFTLWSQGNVSAYVMVNDYPYAIRGDNSGSTNTVYESITGSILVNKNDVIKFKTSKSVTDWGDYNYFYPAKGGN